MGFSTTSWDRNVADTRDEPRESARRGREHETANERSEVSHANGARRRSGARESV
jgi:hypothetical protein